MPHAWVPQDGVTRRVIAVMVSMLMAAAMVVAASSADLARATDVDHADAPTTGNDVPNAGALPKDPLCTNSFSGNWTGADSTHEPGHPADAGPLGPALWANSGSAGAETMDIPGSDNWIDGATVSRDDMKIGGNQNNFLHGTTYGVGETFDLSGNDNCFLSGPVAADPPAGFPVTFSSSDFAPGSTAALFAGGLGDYYVCGFADNGTTVKESTWCDGDDLKVGDQNVVLPEGLYYIKGFVDLSGSDMFGSVTIVTLDKFDASGSSGSDFYAYMRGLLFMTDDSGEDALKTGGSLSTFNEGHLFAPNGRVELSGSRNYFNCTVMGDRVRLNGQNLVVEGQLCDDAEPLAPELTIVKTADPTSVFSGQTVTYTVELINESLTEDVIVDALTDDLGGGPLNLLTFTPPAPIVTNTCNAGAVNGGDDATITVPMGGQANSVTCQFTVVITDATTTYTGDGDEACDTYEKVDLVAASGEGEITQLAVSDDDCAGVDIDPDPEFSVIKTASPTAIYSGDTVTYTVELVNHSDTEDLTIDVLTDDLGNGPLNLLTFTPPAPIVTNTCNAGAVNGGDDATITVPLGGLANSVTCQFTIVVTDATDSYTGEGDDDCDTYDKVDLVAASGEGEESELPVSDDDCAGVNILPDPMLALVKEVVTPAGGALGTEGGNVTYKVTLTNLSTTESITIDELDDDVDGKIYDLLDLTEDADLVSNTCNDALPITIAASGSENCTFTLWVDHTTTTAAGSHDSCQPDGQVIDIVTADATGDTSGIDTNDASDCAEVTVEEPDASLAIDKLVKDPVTAQYVEGGLYPSSEVFPSTAEWKIAVSNPSDYKVINIVFTDPNAPACVTAFTAAMDAIDTGKDWLDPDESVTFTCTDAVASIPFINTAIANGEDVWERAVDEVTDNASLGQIRASGSIGDTVWYDCAGDDSTVAPCDDGVQDAGELGIENAKVTITGLDGQDVDPGVGGIQTTKSLLTDANGKYLFASLPDGNYKVQVLIGDVPDPDALGRTLRFTTASSFTILLPEAGERLDADFGVIADTLPTTGISTDQILLVAMLLLAAGVLGLMVSRRKEDELGTDAAA